MKFKQELNKPPAFLSTLAILLLLTGALLISGCVSKQSVHSGFLRDYSGLKADELDAKSAKKIWKRRWGYRPIRAIVII